MGDGFLVAKATADSLTPFLSISLSVLILLPPLKKEEERRMLLFVIWSTAWSQVAESLNRLNSRSISSADKAGS